MGVPASFFNVPHGFYLPLAKLCSSTLQSGESGGSAWDCCVREIRTFRRYLDQVYVSFSGANRFLRDSTPVSASRDGAAIK
jgi:hypothetical protein